MLNMKLLIVWQKSKTVSGKEEGATDESGGERAVRNRLLPEFGAQRLVKFARFALKPQARPGMTWTWMFPVPVTGLFPSKSGAVRHFQIGFLQYHIQSGMI
jgi:hypothetical protein